MQQRNHRLPLKMFLVCLLVLFYLPNVVSEDGQKLPDKEKEINIDKQPFFGSIQGNWICYKFHKDTIGGYLEDHDFDFLLAKELGAFLKISFKHDTIFCNNLFKMPVYCYEEKVGSLSYGEKDYIKMLGGFKQKAIPESFYFIRPKSDLEYCEYQEAALAQGDTLPAFGTTYPFKIPAPFSRLFAFHDNVLVTSYGSFFYYFEKGDFKGKYSQDIGIPSMEDNRFIVKRKFEDISIKQAVYRLIDEFPKGTEGLLLTSDEPSEPGSYFSETSTEMFTTNYKWEGKGKLTITTRKSGSCNFIFEFNKQGSNVYVKYWNDVVFPFEKGYQGN